MKFNVVCQHKRREKAGMANGRNGECTFSTFWPEWRTPMTGMANMSLNVYSSIVYVYNSILTCIRRLELD